MVPDQRIADTALDQWDVTRDGTARLINLSENATYWVEGPRGTSVMRVHRPGYHTCAAILSELAWLEALDQDNAVTVPRVIMGRDGEMVQQVTVAGVAHFVVLFEALAGEHPDETGDMMPGFEALGAIAARCHTHALNWQRPPAFTRQEWSVETVFGAEAIWGNWRDAPGVTSGIASVLEQVEARVRTRLAAYGRGPDRFNLIHADMRLANVLMQDGVPQVIDFDDCGFGWLMYDFAAAISFIEDDPRVPDLKAAWLRGYRRLRAVSAEDEAEIDTMIMLRRMALLAWIGSHMESTEPQALAPHFARVTAELGQDWLNG